MDSVVLWARAQELAAVDDIQRKKSLKLVSARATKIDVPFSL